MKKLLTLAVLGLLTAAATAQNYDDILRLRQMTQSVSGIRPMADGEHYTVLQGSSLFRYSYADASVRKPLLPVVSGDFHIADYLYSPDEQRLLLSVNAKPIYRHSYTATYFMTTPHGLRPIFQQIKQPREASFSPDSRSIAFSGGNNMYLYDIESEQVTQITTDGRWNEIINGTTDWVYEEEFGFTKAYAFSPDSRRIAYLRFDESEVPLFEMMRYDKQLYNKPYSYKYPKAGETNSDVQLWVYDIENKTHIYIDTKGNRDQYIPHLEWTPGGQLCYYRLNRRQNHFEAVICNADGTQQVIYEEQSPKYTAIPTIQFLDADRFVVRQETATGWMHLYLYSIKKGLLRPITHGEWEVTELAATTDKRLYYISTETSPLRRDLYSIGFDGRGKQRLTGGDGVYAITPSNDMKYYISNFSNAATPNRYDICTADGKVVRTLQDNAELAAELTAHPRPMKEFVTIPTERGDELNAWILRPLNFDPAKKYPILLTQYSGPGSQKVQDNWSLDWENALADAGYIVLCVDGRGTGFRGEAFKKCTYGNLGALEVEDQLSAARYMASQPYIDSARIGIYGWSFGGFMALSCAFKGDGLFKMAIAVAPVTSWRYYDTIYTEVFNNLPQNNPAGYDDNSPIHFADRLNDAKTRLLMIHGTADDNVHFQNAMEMARALNRHDKQYDMMVYPDQNHGMMPSDSRNVRQKMIDYTIKNL